MNTVKKEASIVASPYHSECKPVWPETACSKRGRVAKHPVHRSFVSQLYGCAYDFAEYREPPRLEYMLATLPRSGSIYLATELWRTGVMGAPMEYPNPLFAHTMYARLGVGANDIEAYWERVKRIRTSPNGVFGYKMFPVNYQAWADRFPRMLPRIAPHKVIFLTRASVVDQAVSYSRAMRSGAWFHDVPEREHPAYDAEHIAKCVDFVECHYRFWYELFELTGAQVHHVTYEALLRDHDATIAEIALFLGVRPASSAAIDLPELYVQRDVNSEEWVRRFQEKSCVDNAGV